MDYDIEKANKKAPTISILMGVYQTDKGIPLLIRSIESMLHQTFRDFEFLICDTGSSERVCRLLDEYAAMDSRIRLIRKDGKITLPEKLNLCMENAQGMLIARQDDDDVSLPRRLEIQCEFLKYHTDVGFVGCNVAIENNGCVVGERIFPARPSVKDFRISQPYCHPTLLFRREVLGQSPYDESKWCILCEDYDLLLRLYGDGIIGANLQEIHFWYHVSNVGFQKRKMKHRLNESVTRWKRFRKLGLLPRYVLYVIKPLIVGMMPNWLVNKLRRSHG